MARIIPHNRPLIEKDDVAAVSDSLGTGWLAGGEYVKRFEESVCKYLGGKAGSRSGVAVSSGTAALYLAFYGIGVRAGDELILPTYTCSAVLNAVNLIRARPVLVDIDPDTWNISYESALSAVTKRTRAIVITHTFGMPAEVESFNRLGIPVVEDCAQGLGSSIGGKKAGTLGRVSIFSFYATKMITSGHGGMVVSSDRRIMRKIRDYREFDCRRLYYPRFNFQMTDFQAALGLSQLKRLDRFISKRRGLADRYMEALKPNEGVGWQRYFEDCAPNYYRFVLRLGRERARWQGAMKQKGIQCISPIAPYELLHRYLALDRRNFPVAEEIAGTALSVPVFPALTTADSDRIVRALSSMRLKK